MALVAKTVQQLVTQCIEDLTLNTNLSKLSAGSKTRAILDTVNKRISEAYDVFDLNLARAFLSSAKGEFLDLFGDLLALPRLTSVVAGVDENLRCVKFYVDSGNFGTINGGNDIDIPEGTIIATRANIRGTLYKTTSSFTLLSTLSSAFVAVEAINPGKDSNIGANSLIYHDFTNYTDQLNNSLRVTNNFAIMNGQDLESDENYRYRLSQRVLEAEAANETAIRLAALSAPGVADVQLIKYYRGIGTFAVIIKSTLPVVSDSLINEVTLKIESVKGLGNISFVKKPKETGVSFKLIVYHNATITEEEQELYTSQFIERITSYVNNLDLGDTLYLNRMIAELFTISSTIVAIGELDRPIEEAYIYKTSLSEDGKIRQKLIADYTSAIDERIIIEPSISNPITVVHNFTKRKTQ